MKKIFAMLLTLAMILGMVHVYAEPASAWDGAYMDEEDFKAYTKYDLEAVLNAIEDQLEDDTYAAVKAAMEEGQAAIDAAATVSDVRAAYQAAFAAMSDAIPLADGLFNYKKSGNAERTNLLGLLEQYAVSKGITGITMTESGSYVMYNPRITLGTENYIPGYGFGILAEGNINDDLEYETNDAWKRYYHSYETSDPGTLNVMNDQGSQVDDIASYMFAGHFTNFMNETKDGYDWVPELAKEKPVAVNDDDGDGFATTWRWEVRTGADGLKYKTASEIESRKAFNDRPVELADYEVPWKVMLTQQNGFYRGSESSGKTNGAIVGMKEFYQGTEKGYDEDLWQKVGIKTYVEDGKNYFEVTYAEEQERFYAMYYLLTYGVCPPLPQEFVDLVTPQYLLGYNSDKTETPLDNSLSLGAYYMERYDQDMQIVYAKNPNYVFADTKYAIPGVHLKIFPAAKDDNMAALNEFLAGHFDGSGTIPQDVLDQYRNDPRTHTTTGSSNFKLNVNATDPETWEYLFGENGFVKQTMKDDYWDLKPVMSNRHFVQALGYSIDRLSYANARGNIPSVEYLASSYMSDPENGISYSSTEAHKKAIQSLLEDTDGNGYSLEMARDYFRMALTELEAEGAYTPGTPENPTVIEIEIAWMYPTQEESNHNEIKNYFETAFNDESVSGGVYQLKVNFWVGNEWSDVYYNKLMTGQYDLGFGAISGNALDPIGFVSVLSSDPEISGNFTLNWGTDTNDPSVYPLVYNNQRYSFDALYKAANGNAIIAQGANRPTMTVDYSEIVKNDDGSYTGSFTVTATLPDITTITPTGIMCCNYERYYNGDGQYDETEVEFTVEDQGNGVQVITFTVPAELAADYATGSGTSEAPMGATGFDLYYSMVFNGSAQDGLYYSVNDNFVVETAAE
ncbi:MAG: hypothetical protein IKH57_03275 [Clostridia bacterium]|nr:hypothetical protein [Clostridia bacterium]MBR4359991.1 hypothetical protein [Clostridia bacterium]